MKPRPKALARALLGEPANCRKCDRRPTLMLNTALQSWICFCPSLSCHSSLDIAGIQPDGRKLSESDAVRLWNNIHCYDP